MEKYPYPETENETVRNFFSRSLANRGLAEDEIDKVMTAAAKNDSEIKRSLGNPVRIYSPPVRIALGMAIDSEVAIWMDNEFPTHFARSQFPEGPAAALKSSLGRRKTRPSGRKPGET